MYDKKGFIYFTIFKRREILLKKTQYSLDKFYQIHSNK